MDTEQQIRLNFLDEALECFDTIESNLIGLADTSLDPQQLDLLLRSAHSVKGGAAMMNFTTLSKVAHRLEDFFKILRVRYSNASIETEIETLLLQSLDCLRQVSNLHREGATISEGWLNEHSKPIFTQLRQYLGDLQEADENALLAQDEDVNPALLMFEEGVNTVLDRFETQLSQLDLSDLGQELATTARELVAFGQMADLQSFVELCEDIRQQTEIITQAQSKSLAERSLTLWRRSHALVLRGRIEKLPNRLEVSNSTDIDFSRESQEDLSTLDATENYDFDSLELGNLDELQSAFAQTEVEEETDLDPLELDHLADLQTAFEAEIEEETDLDPLELGDISELSAVFEQIPQNPIQPETPPKPSPQPASKSVGKMVRVPLEQLQQFNNLFEKLVLERNSVNLRLKQLQSFTNLMQRRMQQIEKSNTGLKQWYDRASLEGVINPTEPQLTAQTATNLKDTNSLFDALEMDRYSDLHLICQEQIETIVQLQEVTTDINLGLQELNQAFGGLDQTTKSLQGNLTRTQMQPFAEVVKRFPRLIRDLSLQFGKQVKLKIEGESTLIDRSVIESLSDPLIHLLRNAFDHGIEDPETRVAAGKPMYGTITLQAANRGTYTVITLSDDGAGISIKKIGDRLQSMGIPPTEIDQMPDSQILEFIFEPGFSTAKEVTELSGRGVGMDVVRTNLQDIRGDIRVKTEAGRGTTFTIRIPFSLSILRVMILEQSGFVFAVPVNSVREILRLQPEHTTTIDDLEQLNWNQQTIPLIRLEQSLVFRRQNHMLEASGSPAIERPMALVVGDNDQTVAFHVNRFWSEQEATIRPIESLFSLPPGFTSSMVLGDGKVIPLIDPLVLAEACLADKSEADSRVNSSLAHLQPLVQTKTILVVDDSINVRRYLSLTLEKAGYEIEQARDGQEAVDKLLAGLSVQAVVCDIEMPRLDGYGVLEEIKGRAEFERLPIAMLTSRSNEKHRKLAMNLGASAYFSKPYNEQELLQKLEELIN